MFSRLSTTLFRRRKDPAGDLVGAEPLLVCDGPLDEKPSHGKKAKLDKTISIKATEVDPSSDPDCPICFERVGRRNQDGYLEKWTYLPCGHRFGSACLAGWILGQGNEQHACPTCRRNYHCKCGHLWLPQTSLGKSDRRRLAQANPQMPVPDVCDFCDVRLRKVIPNMWDRTTIEALRRPGLWVFDGSMPTPPPAPRFPPCRSHLDVLWKTWYEAKLQQLRGPRRPPRDRCRR
ncbi:hypothetical protein ACRALDRAFT_2024758 [Sodiomyces alcalophilus JCM 7366]|uniref:uncharacterized protein n=1 Tax=Sodiomyces alcalophilus JCM 7366 TaxID=591952 RepID=UPI0039B5B79F